MSKHGKHHHDQEGECEGKCKEGECECAEEHGGGGECGCGSCQCGHECNCGGNCDCGCGGHFQRRFRTKAEQIAELEAYLGELKLEVQAVEEILADLRK
jgi:hypothetical protein